MNWTRSHVILRRLFRVIALSGLGGAFGFFGTVTSAVEAIDFNRDIRPILSENCIRCHGPDAHDRKGGERSKGGLRLDTREGALAVMNGFAAVVPGRPEESELLLRIASEDETEVMPPPDTHKKLSARQKALLKVWVEQGAHYAPHWSYVAPQRPPLPAVSDQTWGANPVDRFILNRLDREKIGPAPEAERAILARRVALDLTGLPPTPAEVKRFEEDRAPGAYENMVDRLLAQPSFGEHWARLWLDQARYADSAGYADDPLRTIWAYRDYLVRAFNSNKPFDQFTTEQIAGDLLSNPTDEQLVATAFHRNTPTNSEGGTIDEEFRNVAVVDRVNTTMTVWMGSTLACAQCHTHKYDPFTHTDYFRLFAIFNNTADNDQKDESPVLGLFTPEQKRERAELSGQIAALKQVLSARTPALLAAQPDWEQRFEPGLAWSVVRPTGLASKAGAAMTLGADGAITVERKAPKDVYALTSVLDGDQTLTALRVEALPSSDAGEFVVTRVKATIIPAGKTEVAGRFLRIELPGKDRVLSLAEVQIFEGDENIAPSGSANQSSTVGEGIPRLAIDGKTNGDLVREKTTTLTASSENPWWELDLKSDQALERAVERVVIWNRTDGDYGARLAGAKIMLLDAQRAAVWSTILDSAPTKNEALVVSEVNSIALASAHADFTAEGFAAETVLSKAGKEKGWSVGAAAAKAHSLTFLPKAPVVVPAGARLKVTIEQNSNRKYATMRALRLAVSGDPRANEIVRTPPVVLAAIARTPALRTAEENEAVAAHYMNVAPGLQPERERQAKLLAALAAVKPSTTVPVMSEVLGSARRTTHIQRRGNYLDLGDEVPPGTPEALPPLPAGTEANRLGLARWLLDAGNPLTSRVISNLFWESIFGLGLVRTSEDFGSQGDPPSHPELLDWLAVEFRESGWDVKHLLRLMVTSKTYRQSSRITAEALARDADNQLHARGPRFRLSAEMIRDQTLAVSGLLSAKMYGPPVNPPQPKMGVSAAFGSGLDWETSTGEDRYRRGLYTMWRRSNPYPSMATFDAPSREVCTVRRERSNTPLQALVTLNDPVYIEAAQAFARRLAVLGGSPEDRLDAAFRLALSRSPKLVEQRQLLGLLERSRTRFVRDPAQAGEVATNPLGALPAGADVADLAAWTVVANVLLNLDEFLMKP
jgi:hypothetical protein